MITEWVQVRSAFDLAVQFLDKQGNPISIAEAEDLVIRVGLPDGTNVDFGAGLDTDGLDGVAVYHASVDDIVEAGLYSVQGFGTIDGERIPTEVGGFVAKANI